MADEPIYVLRVKGRLTMSQEVYLRKRLTEQLGEVVVLSDDMQLEVLGNTYYKTKDNLPPFGHQVLIWTGNTWDIAYREKRGNTWRWLFIEQEHIDYSVDYWAYLPHPPPIEVETEDKLKVSSTSGKTTYSQ